MATAQGNVTSDGMEFGDSLPEWAVSFAVISSFLGEREIIGAIAKRLRLRRSGYGAIDIVMFVTAYHCSGLQCGFKEFYRLSKPFGSQLAALWGRKKWPTQASVSRALGVASEEDVGRFGEWLLLDSSDAKLWELSTALYSDATGAAWTVFHWDGQDYVFHQRSLSNRAGEPEPSRRSEAISSPGHMGRKRGNSVLGSGKLQHAGTAQWLHCVVRPGNTKVNPDFGSALRQVEKWTEVSQRPTATTLVVVDGVGGGWPQLELGRASSVHVLTRLSCYQLLKKSRVTRALEQREWESVGSSGSGPQRFATDLGVWRGCRIIASRFRGEAPKGAGKTINGWHYELFAITTTSPVWAAADLVELYYGRCGVENRFAQQNRELGLDKIFSYSIGGQQLCVTLGMWLWNLQTSLGARIACGKGEALEIPIVLDPRTSERQILEPPPQEETATEAPPDHLPSVLSEDLPAEWVRANWPNYVDVQIAMATLPEWSWDPEIRTVRCPDGHALGVFNIEKRSSHWKIRFQATMRNCRECPVRSSCTTSTSKIFRKETAIWIPFDAPLVTQDRKPDGVILNSHPLESPSEHEAGPWQMSAPKLLPAELRKHWRRALENARAKIDLPQELSPPPGPKTNCIAPTPEARRHARKTWQDRLQWNARADGPVCHQFLAASDDLRAVV